MRSGLTPAWPANISKYFHEIPDFCTVTDEKKECLVDEFDAIGQGTVLDGLIAFKSGDNSNEGAAKITAAMISCFGLEGFG